WMRKGVLHGGRSDSPPRAPLLLPRERLPGQAQALFERDLRLPAELTLCERDVEDAALQLAEARGRRLGVELRPRHPPARVVELDHRRLLSGADVEDAAVLAGRGHGRARDVAG